MTLRGIAKLPDDRHRRHDVAVGAEMPLEIPDPEHHVGNDGGLRIDLDSQELMGIDGDALQFQPGVFAEIAEKGQHFPSSLLRCSKAT